MQALQSFGLRKFLLAGVGPLGCIPNQLASGAAPAGKCVSFVNDIVGLFNTRLRSLVDQLTRSHPGSIFVYGNTYEVFTDILNNPDSFGMNPFMKLITKGSIFQFLMSNTTRFTSADVSCFK